MATAPSTTQRVPLDTLTQYLMSMARTVEMSVNRALAALADDGSASSEKAPGEIFLLEPRINEMEMMIDDYAVRMMREGQLGVEQIRQVVATLKITNDLERMGDLAVNIGERVVSLAEMPPLVRPPELDPMTSAVGAMVNKSLGALIFRNVVLASEVLESDDLIDRYRDQIFERLMAGMREQPADIAPGLQLVLASRYLERLADHATNIAEDIIYWVRGLDVRHGRALSQAKQGAPVTENS